MKRLSVTIILLLGFVFAQDITNKLGGNTSADTYDITDSGNNLLFQVRGDGRVGLGSAYNWSHLYINKSAGSWDDIMRVINTSTESNTFAVRGYCKESDGNGTGGYFQGGYIGVAGNVFPGNTGIGVRIGVSGDVRGGVGTNMGVAGYAEVDPGGTAWSGYFWDNVMVGGTLTKGAGSFRIDHPLDPENKYLYHSFVESPDMMNIYNGNIITDSNGLAEITMPDYFEVLNRDFRYQLTVIGEFSQAIIKKEIENKKFTILTDKPNVKVSWQITGIRQDAYANKNRIPVEENKPLEMRGKYQNPEAFGQPRSKKEKYDVIQKNIEKLTLDK